MLSKIKKVVYKIKDIFIALIKVHFNTIFIGPVKTYCKKIKLMNLVTTYTDFFLI